jgi:predicted SnoaL-like aldol condensation-catalyzing enzyme
MSRPPATSTRTPSDVAREVFHAIFDDRDLSDPSRYWTDESVDHFVALGKSVRGKDALAGFFRELFVTFPDWTLEIEQTIDDGDRRVVVQWTARAPSTALPGRASSRLAAGSPSAASTSSASTPTARSTRTPSTTTERDSPARSACCPARGRRPTVRCLPPSTSPRRPRSACAAVAAERVMLAQTVASPALRHTAESVEFARPRTSAPAPPESCLCPHASA